MGQPAQYTKIQYAGQTSDISTEGSSYTPLGRVQSCDFRSENNLIIDRGLGEGLNVVNFYYGPYNCSGSIEYNPVDFDFIKHWIGGKSGSGTAGSPYCINEATTVGFSSSSSILQPFSIERLNDYESTPTADVMIGCVGTTFTIRGRVNSKLEFSGEFIGYKDIVRTSGQTYTPITENSFIMIGGTWKWGSVPTALSGVKSFEINYDNGLVTGDETRSIESRFITGHYTGARAYTFRCEIIMSSGLLSTIYTDFYGQTPSSGPTSGSSSINPTTSLQFKVELVNGNKYGTIQLNDAVINRISKPIRIGGGLVILIFEGIAKSGLNNQPFKWWSV